jgi:hypothetical protein
LGDRSRLRAGARMRRMRVKGGGWVGSSVEREVWRIDKGRFGGGMREEGRRKGQEPVLGRTRELP